MEESAVSQNDPSGPAGHPVIQIQLKETGPIHTYITSCDLEMNGNVGGRGPVSSPSDINCNSNSTTMVSDLSSPESQTQSQPFTPRASRTPKKAATFGKRSNSMRRNPKAVVAKQGWLYKQASSGVKQWNKRWFVLTDRCLFYYKDEKEEGVLGSLPLLSFRIGEVQVLDNISRKHAFKLSSLPIPLQAEPGDSSMWPTAEPGPAGAVLPDLGPGSDPPKIMIFLRRSRSQGIRPKFSISTKYVEYCTHYNYFKKLS